MIRRPAKKDQVKIGLVLVVTLILTMLLQNISSSFKASLWLLVIILFFGILQTLTQKLIINDKGVSYTQFFRTKSITWAEVDKVLLHSDSAVRVSGQNKAVEIPLLDKEILPLIENYTKLSPIQSISFVCANHINTSWGVIAQFLSIISVAYIITREIVVLVFILTAIVYGFEQFTQVLEWPESLETRKRIQIFSGILRGIFLGSIGYIMMFDIDSAFYSILVIISFSYSLYIGPIFVFKVMKSQVLKIAKKQGLFVEF